MKSITNRALWAKKKMYIQPSFEITELKSDHMMLPGSPTSGSYDPTKQAPKKRGEPLEP